MVVIAMRNVTLTIVFLLALSAASAKAKDDLPKIDGSIRSTLEVYDKVLVPDDRKGIESFIGGMQIGLLSANVMLKERSQPLLYCFPTDRRPNNSRIFPAHMPARVDDDGADSEGNEAVDQISHKAHAREHGSSGSKFGQ
jgi:hypothetical protein